MWSHASIFPHANAFTHSLSSGLKIDSLHAQNVFSLMIGPCLLTASSFSAFEVSHRVHFNLFQDCFSFAMQINAMWAANYWTVFRIKTQVTNSPFRLHFRFFFSWRKSRTRNSVPSKLIGRSLFASSPSLFIDSEREVCVTLISKECVQFGIRFCKLQLVIHKVLGKQGPTCGKYWAAHFQQLEKLLRCLDVKPHLNQHKMLVTVTSTIVEMETK